MNYLLVFFSGFSGLVYEVLWMKQLGLLFGNTSHAAAATLAAFFAGLAAGNWFWGRRSAGMRRPLHTYALLEAGIAATALIYFVILSFYSHLYPMVFQRVESAFLLLLIKFALALVLIFPPAFCMGGTLPVMGQHVILNLSRFGTVSAALYGVNTLGAALGAGLAGFYLPLWLGYKGAYTGAILVTSAVAVAAFASSRKTGGAGHGPVEGGREATCSPHPEPMASNAASASQPGFPAGTGDGRRAILPICFLSGFGVLALEVLWTRMFSQVLENSVYTFAIILVMVLLCLALGSFISSRLARLKMPPMRMLSVLTLLSGVAVAITPFVFARVSDSFEMLWARVSWSGYMLTVFRLVGLTIALPALLLGSIFPYLMKTEERHACSAGGSLGRLAAVNTAGAILGSLLCGFVLLGTFGLWGTMRALAIPYLLVALLIPSAWGWKGWMVRLAGALAIIMQFTVLDTTGLALAGVDRTRPNDKLVERWEGSDCTVAVTRAPEGLSIKINSDYGLGSTWAYSRERMQAEVPLLAWPKTKSIFFLGVGTGISVGGALDPQFGQVNRVVACELVPEVITAAKKYMTDWEGRDFTGGLFTDPRATVLAEDGRHYLMATRERFDMINSDLFIPYRSGAGSLYSKEHFDSVKARLEPGGVFYQWLPLYQVTDREFGIISRTMLEVFDQVTLWRINFQPGEEVVALAGQRAAGPLPACDLESVESRKRVVEGKTPRDIGSLTLPIHSDTVLFYYCGNLTAARNLFSGYPVNTDDNPLIEYQAPRNYRNAPEKVIPWFIGPRIAKLIDEVQRVCPPDRDPLLANRQPSSRRLPLAGSAFHWTYLWKIMGNEEEGRKAWLRFVAEWTAAPAGGISRR